MKRKSIFVAILAAIMVVCILSCKNGASSDKSFTNGKTDENAKVEVGTSANSVREETNATPLLSVSDLSAVYEHREDTTYFRSHFADKGFKPLLMEDLRNGDDPPIGDWFTEIWGYNMSFSTKTEESYEARLTPEADDALAIIMNHSVDDADAYIYFSNPAYLDIYKNQLEALGLKHYTGEDFDIWGAEGYKHGGEDFEIIYNLAKEEMNEKLYYLRVAFDF